MLYIWRYELRKKNDVSNTNVTVENDTWADTIEEAISKIRRYQIEQYQEFDIGKVECVHKLRSP